MESLTKSLIKNAEIIVSESISSAGQELAMELVTSRERILRQLRYVYDA